MNTFFSFLLLISLGCLIIGLIKPELFSKVFKREMTRKTIGLIFGISLLVSMIALSANAPAEEKKEDTKQSVQTEKKKESKVETKKEPEKPKLVASYNIVERWQIPNGGEGKRIVIPANLQTEEGLLLVCDKIEQDVKNDRNAFVYGHKDEKSADIQKRIGANTTTEEENYLGKNFILDFKKNANSGFHQCTVYPNGVDEGTTKVKNY